MKIADTQPKVIDEVITEVRAIKRAISERHGNDIDSLLDALIFQERNAGTGSSEQDAPSNGGQCSSLNSGFPPRSI
jgi:hypothetical protein